MVRLGIPIIGRARRPAAAISTLAACALMAAPALAQQQDAPRIEPLVPASPLPQLAPSENAPHNPEALWEAYPLNPSQAAPPRATVAAPPAVQPSTAPRPAPEQPAPRTGLSTELVLVALPPLVALVGLIGMLLLRRRRRRRTMRASPRAPNPSNSGGGPSPPQPARRLVGAGATERSAASDD